MKKKKDLLKDQKNITKEILKHRGGVSPRRKKININKYIKVCVNKEG